MGQAERSVAVKLKVDITEINKFGVASKVMKDFGTQTGKTVGSAATSTKQLGTSAAQASGDLDKATKSTKALGDTSSKASADVSKVSKSTKDTAASAQTLGIGMAAAGAAIAAGIGLAVSRFAEFDQQMSNVRAVSGATVGEMNKLTQAALDAGAATKYSASQAATAEAELAKAGISTADILGGGLNGALSLAAAGNLDLANAATISANAMNIFSLKGQDVGHIADVLASGANKSAADVDQLGQALQQSGLVAAQMGLSLEETTGILAAFADNGLKGSDAGTSLKTMLQRLVPTSKEAKNAMEDIGFSAYDAAGNLKGIDEVAGDLQKGLAGLTQKQKDATLATIFGSDAVRGANVLFKLGTAGVDDYTKAVNDQGAAARVAAVNMDNLAGDMENLSGSFETALIKGGSGANDALRGIAQAATNAVNAFADLPAGAQQAAIGISAAAAAALLLGGGLITVIPKIVATKAALDELAVSAPRAAAGLKLVGAAAGVVALAATSGEIRKMAAAAQVAEPATNDLADSLAKVARGGKDAGNFGDLFARGMGPFRQTFEDSSAALDDFGANANAALNSTWYETLFGTAGEAESIFSKRVDEIDKALVQLVQSGRGQEAKAIVDRLSQSTVQFGGSADEVRSKFTGYAAAVDTAAVSNGKYADATGKIGDAASGAAGPTKTLSDEIKDQKDAAKEAKDAYDSLTDAVKNYGDQVANALTAAAGYEGAIDKAADVAKKRNDIQGQINDLTAAGGKKGSINAQFDKDDAKTRADYAERIKAATTETEKSKLRTQEADQLADSQTNRKAALDDNAKQIVKLQESQKDYAKTLDITTEAGRTNQAMLLDIAQAAKDSAVENFKNGTSVEDVQKKMGGARDAFIKQAQDFGASKDEATKLADQLGLTKDNVDQLAQATAVVKISATTEQANADINFTKSLLDSTNGTQATATVNANTGQADGHILQTDGLLDALDGRIVTPIISLDMSRVGPSLEGLQALVNGTAGPRGFWDGGYTGDGGKFEPKGVVHGGEWVFTKEETSNAAPGELAAYAKRLRGYSGGGPVFGDRGMASAAMSTTYGGAVTNDRRINIENVNAADFASFEREADRRSRLHALGRRGAK